MKIGDLVKVQTKHYGERIGIIIEPYHSAVGCEWIVKVMEDTRRVICSPCDLEVVSAGR